MTVSISKPGSVSNRAHANAERFRAVPEVSSSNSVNGPVLVEHNK